MEQCPICLDDGSHEIRYGPIHPPNLIRVCKNGHRAHFVCFQRCERFECPMCRAPGIGIKFFSYDKGVNRFATPKLTQELRDALARLDVKVNRRPKKAAGRGASAIRMMQRIERRICNGARMICIKYSSDHKEKAIIVAKACAIALSTFGRENRVYCSMLGMNPRKPKYVVTRTWEKAVRMRQRGKFVLCFEEVA